MIIKGFRRYFVEKNEKRRTIKAPKKKGTDTKNSKLNSSKANMALLKPLTKG